MPPSASRERVLIALGGNALIKKGQQGTIGEQFKNLTVPVRQIAALSRDRDIIITHGNGPQVGNLLLQQESCADVPSLPLEILVAMTQGQIGYMIESTLDTQLMELGVEPQKSFLSLISYVVVDENDPAFKEPSKPIGPVYAEEDLDKVPYPTVKTAKGHRRVVVSPKPITIVEKHEIKELLALGYIVICCGGGGIPVVREGRRFAGVDAVIDKDLASVKLAEEVGVDTFIIATDVEGVYLDYGTENQRLLRTLTLTEAEQYSAQGQFPAGSMLPKIQASAEFIRQGGKRAVITSTSAITKAVQGRAGTEIIA